VKTTMELRKVLEFVVLGLENGNIDAAKGLLKELIAQLPEAEK